MLSAILGLIGLIITVVFVVALHSLTSFNLNSFSLFFIVPVGAIATGSLACLGYYYGILKSNIKVTKAIRYIAIIIACVCFVAIQYGYYYTAYIDENYILNYKMQGEHVSNFFLADSDEPLNFVSFTVYMVNSSVISFSRRATQLAVLEGNKILNWVFYAIDFLGMLAGAFFARQLVLGEKKYCDNCKRYMKHKNLLKFPAHDNERLTRFRSISNADSQEIVALIEDDGNTFDEDYFEVKLHYCDVCNSGILELQYMELGSKNKVKHIEEKSVEVAISSNIVREMKQHTITKHF